MAREFAFPGTRPRFAPDRVVDIQHIALVLDVDPTKRTVAGTATLRAMVIAPNTKVVELDAVELVDLGPPVRKVEDLPSDQPSASDVGDRGTGVFGHAMVVRDAREVDHLVDDLGRGDLAAQAMTPDVRQVHVSQRCR
ncbi:MAG TPA: hypothetical protein VIV11_40165, partial [Kofleriaceae bacterium]